MSSSTQKRAPSAVGGIFKFLGLLLFMVVIIFVVGYCYLRFSMGIDVFDIVKKLNLLKQGVSESQVVTQPYDNQDSVDGLQVLFGSNTIYTQDGQEYVFDEDEFIVSELVGDVNLTDEQFAGVMNLFLNNIYSASGSQDFAQFVQLKQVKFDNFKISSEKTNVDVTVVSKLDFSKFKESMNKNGNFVVDILNGLIPNDIYVTANITVTIDEANSNSFTTKGNYVIINNLSKEDSKGVLDLLDIVAGNSGKSLVEEINSTFATLMFGNDEQEGFLNVITGYSSFTFEQESTNIYISLKKA